MQTLAEAFDIRLVDEDMLNEHVLAAAAAKVEVLRPDFSVE